MDSLKQIIGADLMASQLSEAVFVPEQFPPDKRYRGRDEMPFEQFDRDLKSMINRAESERKAGNTKYWEDAQAHIAKIHADPLWIQAKAEFDAKIHGLFLDKVEEAGVSPRHRGKTFESYNTTINGQGAAKAAVEAIEANDASSAMVVLMGPPGTGKTHLGSACVYRRIKRSGVSLYGKRGLVPTALIVCASDISRRVRATYSDDNSQTEEKVLERFSCAKLLVIDEIGAGSGSDHEKQMLCQVICKRYDLKLPTIMITNLGPEALKLAIGDRVFDRIREDEGSAFIPMEWPSQRPAQRGAK